MERLEQTEKREFGSLVDDGCGAFGGHCQGRGGWKRRMMHVGQRGSSGFVQMVLSMAWRTKQSGIWKPCIESLFPF